MRTRYVAGPAGASAGDHAGQHGKASPDDDVVDAEIVEEGGSGH